MTHVPNSLNSSDCHLLLHKLLEKQSTPAQRFCSCRNFTMALLMLDAGLRVGEVVNLRIVHLVFAGEPTQSVVVTSDIAKNGKERCIPTSSRLRAAIRRLDPYWQIHAPCHSQLYAFTTRAGIKHLTTRQVERILSLAAIAAINRPINPHSLRHTFATRLMKRVSMRVVQQLLGHDSITSTQIYTHPDAEDLKNAINHLDEDVSHIANRTY